MPSKNTTDLLLSLRALMKKVAGNPVSAYIVPSNDAHFSEYTNPCDERRTFISGFTGSAGTAIITENEALLWTDGRYYLQAESELDINWTLMKDGLSTTLSQSDWLNKHLTRGSRVGVDPTLFPQKEWVKLETELKKDGKILTAVKENLIDIIWNEAKGEAKKPLRPMNKAIFLPTEFSGKSTKDKLTDIRNEMKNNSADILVISELDEIAWVLNLRGSDIPYNPVFFSYLLIVQNGFEMFISNAKLDQETREMLKIEGSNNANFFEYEEIYTRLEFHVKNTKEKIWLSKNCNYAITSLVPEDRQIIKLTPVKLMKSIKNPVEVQGMINAHIRDAAALCRYFAWLEGVISKGEVTEISAADKLETFRAKQKNFVGLSFGTISGSGPNGAIIHYHPMPETNRKLSVDELYLVDSGGQYLDGTTDVTRTLHFGTPTEYQKECFTRVLKGQISLFHMIFPTKVVGNVLDSMARQYLWKVGLDYGHGTGHGIGAYLNVHEGPQGVTYKHLPDDSGLEENMFISNEPGYYEPGQFGIRLENIIRITKADTKYNFNNRGYLKFEDVTLVPIQIKMIAVDLLTQSEIDYINDYHMQCRKIVGEYLDRTKEGDDADPGFYWLLKETEPLRVDKSKRS